MLNTFGGKNRGKYIPCALICSCCFSQGHPPACEYIITFKIKLIY